MATIDTIGGHGVLSCDTAYYRVSKDDAEIQGVDVESPENAVWIVIHYDITENAIVEWGPWRHNEERTSVAFADGSCNVLKVHPEKFDQMYRQWLSEHQRFPELN